MWKQASGARTLGSGRVRFMPSTRSCRGASSSHGVSCVRGVSIQQPPVQSVAAIVLSNPIRDRCILDSQVDHGRCPPSHHRDRNRVKHHE
jgi:hypothetical protein